MTLILKRIEGVHKNQFEGKTPNDAMKHTGDWDLPGEKALTNIQKKKETYKN